VEQTQKIKSFVVDLVPQNLTIRSFPKENQKGVYFAPNAVVKKIQEVIFVKTVLLVDWEI